MPRFAANLTMLFTELPFAARFDAAAAAGFGAVEFLFPYEHPAAETAAWARGAGVEIVLFNLPPGDWAAGERGVAALPGRERDFADGLGEALDYAAVLGVPRLHAMAAIGGDRATYVANLRAGAARCAAAGIDLLIEPLCRAAMPGYFLYDFDVARAIVADVGAANLRVQADLFHIAGEGGDVVSLLEAGLGDVGHVQVAAPGTRHEPDTPDCAVWFAALDRLGYAGWVGAEYRPRGITADGLGWYDRWRHGGAAPK